MWGFVEKPGEKADDWNDWILVEENITNMIYDSDIFAMQPFSFHGQVCRQYTITIIIQTHKLNRRSIMHRVSGGLANVPTTVHLKRLST